MTNAGGIWEDKSVVVDGNIVSSRKPQDLPDYMKAYVKLLLSN
jgi:protease I